MTVLQDLLLQPESAHLDFKQQWSGNPVDLLHDILCLANSRCDQTRSRYLVIGIEDKTRRIIGIKDEENRMDLALAYGFLKGKRLNRLPTLNVYTEIVEGKQVDVLEIRDLPFKPYFIQEDFAFGKRRMRAGVIYERVGDTNTEIDRGASDQSLEWMIKERLGLTLEPMEKVLFFLKDVDSWVKKYDSRNREFFYHKLHPEIRIVNSKRDDDRDLTFHWAWTFADQNVQRSSYFVNYYGVEIAEILVLFCDGGRAYLVQPEYWIESKETGKGHIESVYYIENSLQFLFQQVVEKILSQSSLGLVDGVISIFDSMEDAERELKDGWEQRLPQYVYYRVSQNKAVQICGTEEDELTDRRHRHS